MIETHADAILPATPKEAYDVVLDLSGADWLPSIKGVKHVSGPKSGVGAVYLVEVGAVGQHLKGQLVCREAVADTRVVYELEEGIELRLEIDITKVRGGCQIDVGVRYRIPGAFGGAFERASLGAAKREVARAVEQLAARFGRRDVA